MHFARGQIYDPVMRAAAMLLLSLFLAAALAPQQPTSLREEQLAHPRVKAAARDKDAELRALFQQKNLPYPPRRILLRAFKREAILEVWVSNADGPEYILLKSIRICSSSGRLGPKRRDGDSQVPEGFYEIDHFNPESAYYLSLQVSYPNLSDRVLGSSSNLGGDIFVHGNCVTIGCLPITDDGIKQVYWLAVLARQSGQRHIPIWIFPTRLTNEGFRALAQAHRDDIDLVAFWRNLKQGFDYFDKEHRLPQISISQKGLYQFVP
jgi:murein L,D-transpeptidase YafK